MRYYLKLVTGEVFEGTPRQIVTELRLTSYLERGLSNWQYRRNFARRHNIAYSARVRWWTDRAFVRDLLHSPLTVAWGIK